MLAKSAPSWRLTVASAVVFNDVSLAINQANAWLSGLVPFDNKIWLERVILLIYEVNASVRNVVGVELGASGAVTVGMAVGLSMLGLAIGEITGELIATVGLGAVTIGMTVAIGVVVVGVGMVMNGATGLCGDVLRSIAPESDALLLFADVPMYAPSPTAITMATMVNKTHIGLPLYQGKVGGGDGSRGASSAKTMCGSSGGSSGIPIATTVVDGATTEESAPVLAKVRSGMASNDCNVFLPVITCPLGSVGGTSPPIASDVVKSRGDVGTFGGVVAKDCNVFLPSITSPVGNRSGGSTRGRLAFDAGRDATSDDDTAFANGAPLFGLDISMTIIFTDGGDGEECVERWNCHGVINVARERFESKG